MVSPWPVRFAEGRALEMTMPSSLPPRESVWGATSP